MAYQYRVAENEAQRGGLRGPIGADAAPARMLTRTRVLLEADHGEGGPRRSDAEIGEAPDGKPNTMHFVNYQFVTEGPPRHLRASGRTKRLDRSFA